MLNTPNEWHNSENSNEEYVEDENYSYDEYSDDEYSDEEYLEEGEYSEEDYDEEYEEYEEDDDGGSDDGGLKKKLIIGAVILLLLSLTGFGAYSLMSKKPVTVANNQPIQENTQAFNNESGDDGNEAGMDGEDISIDVESDGDDTASENGENGENGGFGEEEELFAFNQKSENNDENQQNVDISDEESSLTLTTSGGKEKYDALKRKNKENKDVSVALGDVGRSDPFMPPDGEVFIKQEKSLEDIEGLDFEVIEPPELAPVQPEMSRLLNTKVSGILYDDKKPSAIVNIDGADQLVRIGDVIEGFEFVDITKNKVVIKSDNNVYRASVGQPLNAEKIVNQVEISNLETKFLGSQK